MKICKYCKKPISDNDVWNPDSEGNGYHHACLCEMEFRLRDRQIYDKGRADVLDKIRAEIEEERKVEHIPEDVEMWDYIRALDRTLSIIDKYRGDNK